MLIGGKTVEHFDESEVREIEIDDRNYPELLKSIKKPPKALRVRVNLPPNRKFIAISGSRETTQQALECRIQNRQDARPTRIHSSRRTCGDYHAICRSENRGCNDR